MEELVAPIDPDEDESPPVTDGGERSPTTLGRMKESVEDHYDPAGILDRLPGRLVFVAGALSGSLLTVILTFLYVRLV